MGSEPAGVRRPAARRYVKAGLARVSDQIRIDFTWVGLTRAGRVGEAPGGARVDLRGQGQRPSTSLVAGPSR